MSDPKATALQKKIAAIISKNVRAEFGQDILGVYDAAREIAALTTQAPAEGREGEAKRAACACPGCAERVEPELTSGEVLRGALSDCRHDEASIEDTADWIVEALDMAGWYISAIPPAAHPPARASCDADRVVAERAVIKAAMDDYEDAKALCAADGHNCKAWKDRDLRCPECPPDLSIIEPCEKLAALGQAGEPS